MKFHYYYRNRENELLDDWISAKNRDEAYFRLKAHGIKPSKVEGRNPLEWKRWSLISALVLLCLWLMLILRADRQEAKIAVRKQLYGDPVTLKRLSADGWSHTFDSAGDIWFARHAIPANNCGDEGQVVDLSTKLIRINTDDPEELAHMKRMINGMKIELGEYLNGGGSVQDYISLCCERQASERIMQAVVKEELEKVKEAVKNGNIDLDEAADAWECYNMVLRDAGLPTVFFPEEWGEGL